jgi:hypothetical protein
LPHFFVEVTGETAMQTLSFRPAPSRRVPEPEADYAVVLTVILGLATAIYIAIAL